MSGIVLTAYSGAILGPIAKFLGYIMNWIYEGFKFLGIESVVLSIIVITIIIYMCMLPLTIKQQKFSKLSQKMQPELQKVQDKYKNKRDQASMTAMQQETQLIYEKYGVSPMGSCLPLLIQMPILFALYRVFYNIPAYLSGVKAAFGVGASGKLISNGLVEQIVNTDGYEKLLKGVMKTFDFTTSSGLTASNVVDKLSGAKGAELHNYIVDILYKLPSKAWNGTGGLSDAFSGLGSVIDQVHDHVNNFNYFIGLNISDTPSAIISNNMSVNMVLVVLALLIPVLSFATQMINIKMMPQATTDDNNQMARQMKVMNYMMPVISFIFCFTVPVGLGIYWIFNAVVRAVQQFFINRHIANLDLEEVMAKNREKAKKKREKRGIAENQIRDTANIRTKNIESRANVNVSDNEDKLEKAASMKANAKAGSLASKANLVKEFNERNSRK